MIFKTAVKDNTTDRVITITVLSDKVVKGLTDLELAQIHGALAEVLEYKGIANVG